MKDYKKVLKAIEVKGGKSLNVEVFEFRITVSTDEEILTVHESGLITVEEMGTDNKVIFDDLNSALEFLLPN